ncbi:MAG: hypothetical protein HGA49_04225 [Eubacteriaceae bacterium]|nr:hypothetical protein [Eubacteriaceae bacterium]
MSLFLGKVHYWLYNKINWFEALELELIGFAKEAGLPAAQWTEEIYNEFGYPTGNRPLEEIIDTGNIHGWLQDKIQRAELRHAALITKTLDIDPSLIEGIGKVFEKQGRSAALSIEEKIDQPEAAFNSLNDFILDGMPCDRVNEVVSSDIDKITWKRAICLHSTPWSQVNGDVSNFYRLRDQWIEAFIGNISETLNFSRISEDTQEIRRIGA